MSSEEKTAIPAAEKNRQVIDIALRLTGLAVLIGWSYRILSPFITPLIWAAILSVTLYPAYKKLKKWMKGRGTLAAIIITVMMFLIFLLPAIWLGLTTSQELKKLADDYRQGNVKIPPPPDYVKTWPLVGKKLNTLWTQASDGIDTFIQKYPAQAKSLTSYVFGLLVSTGKAALILALAIIISGFFLTFSEKSENYVRKFFNRLLGNANLDFSSISAATIRSVVRGILGVSFIQAVLAGIGFVAVGLPAAGIWALICMLLAIIQIGMTPVAILAVVYVWNTSSTTAAILFTIWMVLVNMSNNILQPILMGRHAPAPMLVVFLGALGGFIASGFVGLFTGAVILSVGYKLFDAWMNSPSNT